ncbi:MAG: type II secretion system protein GspL [Hyphomonas sp.]
MKSGIYIELPSRPDAEPKFARAHGGRLEALSASAVKTSDRANAVAFAPALSVARFRVPIAAKSESEARKVALYAIEDDLAQPVEDVHVTLAPRNAGAPYRDVFIVDQALLKSWKETLSALDLGHAVIIAEASLPFAPGSAHDFGDRILVNGSDGVVAADAGWPDEAIEEFVQAAGVPNSHRANVDALATLAALHAAHPGTALSGANGGQKSRGDQPGGKSWRFVASMAVIAAGLWIGSIWIETNSLRKTAAEYEAVARATFRTQFPAAPEPADIHTEAKRLAALQAGTPRAEFRALTTGLYQAITGSSTIRLVSLTYSAPEQALRARLQFANRPDEAAFRSRLESSGWSMETTGSVDGPSSVGSDIIMRAQP